MRSPKEKFAQVARVMTAGIWAFAALSKVAFPPLAGSWITTFPLWLQGAVILSEAMIAAVIVAGRPRLGIGLGMGMLLVFALTLVFDPPVPGQTCGCLGRVAVSTDPSDVAAHLFSFASWHLLALAVLGTTGRHASGTFKMTMDAHEA